MNPTFKQCAKWVLLGVFLGFIFMLVVVGLHAPVLDHINP